MDYLQLYKNIEITNTVNALTYMYGVPSENIEYTCIRLCQCKVCIHSYTNNFELLYNSNILLEIYFHSMVNM